MTTTTFTNISLFITYVFPNITSKRITHIFESLRIGQVSHTEFYDRLDRNGKKYYSVHIHFTHWYDNVAARNFQARVCDPNQEARLVYDDPWYWIVNKSATSKKCKALQEAIALLEDINEINNKKRQLEEELANLNDTLSDALRL